MTDKPETFGQQPSQGTQPLRRQPRPLVITLPQAVEATFKEELSAQEIEPVNREVGRRNDHDVAYVTYSFAPESLSREQQVMLLELSEKHGINHQQAVREAGAAKERHIADQMLPDAKRVFEHDHVHRDRFTVSFRADGLSETADLRRLKFEGAVVELFAARKTGEMTDLPDLQDYVTVKTEKGKMNYHFHIPITVPAGVTATEAITKKYGKDYAQVKDIARKHSGNVTIDGAPANYLQ